MKALYLLARNACAAELSMPAITLMAYLGMKEEPVKMSDLATAVGCSAATITGLVDRLETMKMVVRMYDATDRRKVFVNLTRAGRKRMQEVMEGQL
jgi:MarR family transcriptional regulator, organic hydroperoxide resistance regulator